MPVIRSGSAEPIALDGVRFTPCSGPASGGSELAVWLVEFDGGGPGTPHHLDREEVLHVLSGSLRVELDGAAAEVAAGDTVLIPAGTLLAASSSGPARALGCARAGLAATMADGSVLRPPWAN
ncbi:MAG: hypothetical protein V7637_4472 [Mycobacteriales bacterium]|jgi:quercetin dioxygenase-like cupin family protein